MYSLQTLLVLAAFALIIVGSVLWQAFDPAFLLKLRTTPREDQVALWRERIRVKGPEAAYEDFARAEQNVQVGEQHRYAHIFGNALFAETDVRGVTVCDMRFQFGCLHEYFGHVIATHGVSVLPAMVEACREKTGITHPCEHAMGHGILANLGYDEPSLLMALQTCDSVYKEDPINGCMGGAFMEYNLYESLSLESKPRDALKDGWYSPCVSLPDEYQRSCSYWLPQWWHEYMLLVQDPSPSSDERFRRMGDLCRNLPEGGHHRDCFQQIGQLTIWDGFDAARAVRLCRQSSESADESLYCRSYAAYMFHYYEPDSHKALALCRGLSSAGASFCEQYARGAAYTPHDIPLPRGLF